MINSPTVYVVDADADARETIQAAAASANFNMAMFTTAESFLENYVPNRPACLVVDIQLPGMNGLELTQALRREGEDIPVIIHTRQNGTKTVVRAMQAGAFNYVEKTVDGQQLIELIDGAIREHAQHREERPPSEPNDEAVVKSPSKSGRSLSSQRNKVKKTRHKRHRGSIDSLSPRLRETLQHLMLGDNEKQVAYKLKLSPYTIHDYVKALYKHFEVSSRAELLAKCWGAEIQQLELV